jgi:ribosome assembly protein RRB1
MHEMGVEWPCLSFDLIPDTLGFMRRSFPQTLYLCAGTQAVDPLANRLVVMKVSNLTEMPKEADDDPFEEEDDDLIPIVKACHIKLKCGVNRVKTMPQNGSFVASWLEDSSVSVHNVAPLLRSLDDDKGDQEVRVLDWKPVAGFAGHTEEGFALAWSGVTEGSLLSGDRAGAIHLWEPEVVAGRKNWAVDTVPFKGHTGSVEDLVWSPTEARVFASCSTDKTVMLWDARGKKTPVMTVRGGHQDEVNVMSWNAQVTHLLATGADDGVWKVHDLRKVRGETKL